MIPYGNNILVKCFPSDEVSEGGIFVPESAREDSNKVRIVKVGEGTEKTPMRLKAGDIGFRVRGWGTEILIDGEKHFIMGQDGILALEE